MIDRVVLSVSGLSEWSVDVRRRLERAFSAETAQSGWSASVPSSGQCAAVAVIVHELIGGQLVSARVNGRSHWFNRLRMPDGEIDLDITADQFGYPPVRVSPAGELYPETCVRQPSEVTPETRARSELLKHRAKVSRASS